MNMKPYRLVSRHELNELQQRFTEKLLIWNEESALFSLTCALAHASKPDIITGLSKLMTEQKQPIALLPQQDLSMIAHCLFGDVADCFNHISNTLWIDLLNRLLGTQSLQQHDAPQIDEWFYHGSPALRLTLHCANQSMTLYLHPQWVLNALPQHERSSKAIGLLDDALAHQILHLDIALNPVPLTLLDITNLRVGDVIKTDHPTTTPLSLKYHQQSVCSVNIGETNQTKSIQITRSS